MHILATSIEASNQSQHGFGIIDPIIAIACALLVVWFVVKKIISRFARQKHAQKILGIASEAIQNLRSLRKTYFALAKAVSDRLEEQHLYPIIDTLYNEVDALIIKLLHIQGIKSADEITAFLKITEKRLSEFRTAQNEGNGGHIGWFASYIIQDIDKLDEFEQILLRIRSTEDPDFHEAVEAIGRKSRKF